MLSPSNFRSIRAYLCPSSSSSSSAEEDTAAAVMYTVVTPLLNPFIYSLRNKDMKDALGRLLRGKVSFSQGQWLLQRNFTCPPSPPVRNFTEISTSSVSFLNRTCASSPLPSLNLHHKFDIVEENQGFTSCFKANLLTIAYLLIYFTCKLTFHKKECLLQCS